MNNKERLISLIGFTPAANSAEGALIDQGVVSTDVYVGPIDKIKKAAIEVMQALITTADTSNSITGFGIKYDRAAILKLISQFEDDLGITEGARTIKGIQPW